jgi:catechol-2,3-dioxygenase
MKRIDHVAIQVNNVKESVSWYLDNFDCMILYCDDTWAFLQFDNIKLALVLESEHPLHIAFKVNKINGVEHRDGSIGKYIEDNSGNKIELIQYEKEKEHN